MRKKRREDTEEKPMQSVDGFLMAKVAEAVDSFEWDDYEIVVRCRARKIVKGFEIKSPTITSKKLTQPT